MEILRSWGLEERVYAAGQRRPAASRGSRPCWPVPCVAGRRRWASRPPSRRTRSARSPRVRLPQDHLEPVLLEHLRERGGRGALPHRAGRAGEVDGDGVRAGCRTGVRAGGTTSAPATWSARTARAAPSAGRSASGWSTWARRGGTSTYLFGAELDRGGARPAVRPALDHGAGSGGAVRAVGTAPVGLRLGAGRRRPRRRPRPSRWSQRIRASAGLPDLDVELQGDVRVDRSVPRSPPGSAPARSSWSGDAAHPDDPATGAPA